jgi:hypothetical protein
MQNKPKNPPEPSSLSILPVHLQLGDRYANEAGE